MLWFKHDSDANSDAKLKRLRMKYGLEGYGLYWYCLELIAGSISKDNLTFELEHDAEIISFDTGIHFERVQEMMTYMVGLGLFEEDQGAVTCMKLAKRLDKSMTNSQKMREMIDIVRERHDIVSECHPRIEEKRIDKKKKEEKESNQNELSLPDFISKEQWKELLAIKKKATKVTATDRTKRQLLATLIEANDLGYTVTQVLDLWSDYPNWKTMKLEYLKNQIRPANPPRRVIEQRQQIEQPKSESNTQQARAALDQLKSHKL